MTAGRCPACRGSVSEQARFCRSCGVGLDNRPQLAARLRRDAPSRWWLAAAVAALVLAVIGGTWAASRAGDGPGAGPEAGAAASGSRGTDPSGMDDDGPPPSGSDEAAEGPVEVEAVLEVVKGTGPVLSRPVGWSLVLGDLYRPGQGLWRLDLDTGRLVEFPAISGGPVLAVGDRVVLVTTDVDSIEADGAAGTVQVVNAADPTVGTVAISEDEEPAAASPLVWADPGDGETFWLYSGDTLDARWRLFGLDGGERQDAIEAGPFGIGLVPGAGPEVATSLGGGVFRRVGDGYRLVAPGRPIAAQGHSVLVVSCSSPTECTLGWIDRDSGQAVDRPVPALGDALGEFGGSIIPGSDRYLFVVRGGSRAGPGLPVLVDLDTGRTVELEVGDRPLASSPDGRYLVVIDDHGTSQPVMIDLESGERLGLARPAITNVAAVFVPNG